MATAYISHPDCLKHDIGENHPECAARLNAIENKLIASGLMAQLLQFEAPQASIDQLARVHPRQYIGAIHLAAPQQGFVYLDPDTAMNPHTWNAALHAAWAVVLALGQDVDLSLLDGVPGLEIKDGTVQVAPNMMTGKAGIFVGGDMVPSGRTVTVAVGHGKKAARNIDAWLRGIEYKPEPKHELVCYDKLNPWYYTDAHKTVRPVLDIVRRQTSFDEVQGELDESNALYEARRCLSCGNCFECDNCYGVCPDNAVIKLGPGNRFKFNYDYCKGCGICVAECPCGAIKIVPENI